MWCIILLYVVLFILKLICAFIENHYVNYRSVLKLCAQELIICIKMLVQKVCFIICLLFRIATPSFVTFYKRLLFLVQNIFCLAVWGIWVHFPVSRFPSMNFWSLCKAVVTAMNFNYKEKPLKSEKRVNMCTQYATPICQEEFQL